VAENNPLLPNAAGEIVYLILVAGRLFGQATRNYVYVHNETDALPVGNKALLGADWWNYIGATWADAVSVDWTLQSLAIKYLTVYGDVPTIISAGDPLITAPIVGVQAASCPPQDAVVIKRTTNTIGKRGRGRSYIAGVAEVDHTGGELTVGAQGRFQALAAFMAGGFLSQGKDFSHWHCEWEQLPGPPVVSTLRGDLVQNTSADAFIRSQRRRQIGRGA